MKRLAKWYCTLQSLVHFFFKCIYLLPQRSNVQFLLPSFPHSSYQEICLKLFSQLLSIHWRTIPKTSILCPSIHKNNNNSIKLSTQSCPQLTFICIFSLQSEDLIEVYQILSAIEKPTDFAFLKVIGKGSFGKVLLAKHKMDGKFYAVKVLHKKVILKRKEQRHIMAERNVLLKNVKHPFLVGLHYSFQTTDKLYFVLDFINGGELFFHLQRERCFPEARARFYAAEIASALGYLHSLNIVYRDLKPENILLDSQGHIVLTDFGLCKEGVSCTDTTSTFCGTPEYLAPEVLRKQPYDNTVDWWCLGSVLYEMLYGLPPFYSRDTAEMYEHILHKPLQLRPGTSNSACSILEGLLEKDRQRRLGAKEDFAEINCHPFFDLINWEDLDQKEIPPPFNPSVAGPEDLQNFDPEFTEEQVPHSICQSPDRSIVNASVLEADDAFIGFSYAPPIEDSFL
uniref:non-specific serine/threonine protein kinase n=1 Tax=Callorhinchus milii TaxID=7868 RepID=A0A4W3GDI7_CALMI